MKKMSKTNPNLISLIGELREKGYSDSIGLWVRLSKILLKPTRRRCEVNLSKINRYTADGETIVVPGKVLGTGVLDHNVTVAAFAFSKSARDKIDSVGESLSLAELMEKNPKGSNVRIFGG